MVDFGFGLYVFEGKVRMEIKEILLWLMVISFIVGFVGSGLFTCYWASQCDKYEGHLQKKKCPDCGTNLYANKNDDVWCSSRDCLYGKPNSEILKYERLQNND